MDKIKLLWPDDPAPGNDFNEQDIQQDASINEFFWESEYLRLSF